MNYKSVSSHTRHKISPVSNQIKKNYWERMIKDKVKIYEQFFCGNEKLAYQALIILSFERRSDHIWALGRTRQSDPTEEEGD